MRDLVVWRWLTIRTGVEYTQGYGCWLCLHVGSTVFYVGRREGDSLRLELFTPLERFRVAGPINRGIRRMLAGR